MAGVSLSHASSGTVNRGGVPAWVTAPEVRGLNEVDRLLQCRLSTGCYTYTPTLNYARPLLAWQWKRDGVAIAGATDPVYVPQAADEGKAITVTVTLTGEHGSASSTSGSTFGYSDKPLGVDLWEEKSVSNVIVANTATTTINLKTTGGWKTSKTTGSMTAGSPTLTVADASGFAIGDQIIVETGGEAGGGVWGTLGVGGSWPTLYYADATAMNADTSKSWNTYAWIQSTGRVYRWNSTAWEATWTSSNDPFYFTRATPKALVTTITNKVGNVLTLNANAVVSTTNANVYFDIIPKVAQYFNTYSGGPVNTRFYLPAGEYAASTEITVTEHRNFYFEGDGNTSILFSPDGCPSIAIVCSSSHRTIWRNFKIRGNHKLDRWGIKGWLSYPRGFQFSTSFSTLFDSIESELTLNDAFVFGTNCPDSAMRNIYARRETPVRMYLQWVIATTDNSDVSLIDCEIDSDYQSPGIEAFRADRSNIIRFVGRNALLSMNTSGGWWIDTPTMIFNEDCIYGYDPALDGLSQQGNPLGTIFNLNTNIGNFDAQGAGLNLAALGGTVLNPTITFEGLMETAYKIRNRVITVAPAMKGVMIKGGTFTMSPYVSGTNAVQGVISDGDSATIAGTRFIGFDGGTDSAVYFRWADRDGHGRVVGCIGENIQAHVNQRNQTNAQYIAGGGS